MRKRVCNPKSSSWRMETLSSKGSCIISFPLSKTCENDQNVYVCYVVGYKLIVWDAAYADVAYPWKCHHLVKCCFAWLPCYEGFYVLLRLRVKPVHVSTLCGE